MLFNSIDFAIFLPVVFFLYWYLSNHHIKIQNALLVAASYLFYGWWDWRFLTLIIFSSLVDYSVGIGLQKERNEKKRRFLLWISILCNLGLLGFFKYYNFFIDNFVTAFTFLGNDIKPNTLNIILPVGISFYTFQTLSYTIDVYRRKLDATTDLIAFAAFVSFFPQLVAGPIERATNLLPQFFIRRRFNYKSAIDGSRQILWGLFKKVVIADNCAEFANLIFNNSSEYSGSTLVLGAFFFAMQIYGDFSGYSDIAIGTARLFGFNLMRNFSFPYFSRDIAEFWRRWHISLSTWFRDYVYIPLGGSRGGMTKTLRNTIIIFAVSGFWHGSNWTFVIWGLINAIYFIPLLLLKRNRRNFDTVASGRLLPNLKDSLSIFTTFCMTLLAWIFFRAESVSHALNYIADIFSASLFSMPVIFSIPKVLYTLSVVLIFLIIEWIGREKEFAIADLEANLHWSRRYMFYYSLVFLILWFGGSEQEFIYFQF